MSVQTAAPEQARSARPVRDGIGLGLAVGISGIAFGAAAVSSGLTTWQACALSLLVFTGASQFALASAVAAGPSGNAWVVNSNGTIVESPSWGDLDPSSPVE